MSLPQNFICLKHTDGVKVDLGTNLSFERFKEAPVNDLRMKKLLAL